MKSNYTYTIDGNIVFVEDMGGNEFASVTNTIESVLNEISSDLMLHGISATGINNFKVIYRDSTGNIDGVIINSKGLFQEFYYIGETDFYAAKLKIK